MRVSCRSQAVNVKIANWVRTNKLSITRKHAQIKWKKSLMLPCFHEFRFTLKCLGSFHGYALRTMLIHFDFSWNFEMKQRQMWKHEIILHSANWHVTRKKCLGENTTSDSLCPSYGVCADSRVIYFKESFIYQWVHRIRARILEQTRFVYRWGLQERQGNKNEIDRHFCM